MSLATLSGSIVSVFLVTFATAVIPNPSTVGASRYALVRGTRAAAVFLGAVLVLDTAVFLLLACGLAPALPHLSSGSILFPLAGIGLMVIGAVMVVSAYRQQPQQQGPEIEESTTSAVRGPFLAGLLVAGSNPGFWIWWATVGTAIAAAGRTWGSGGVVLVFFSFLIGVLAWYLPLLWALHRGRQVVTPAGQRLLLIGLGLGMACFGLHLLWKALHVVVG